MRAQSPACLLARMKYMEIKMTIDMNKRKFRLFAAGALAVAVLLSAAGCTVDETAGIQTTGETLAVSVSDGGFKTDGTRATENGYTTTFTAGDKIGVFAVVDGAVNALVNNTCLTAADDGNGGLTWQTDDGNALISIPCATYYAYYPYQASLEGELVPTASDADGFFANVISSWTVNDDQSTYEAYTASDLMVAKGTAADNALTFTMAHKMALVVVDLPNIKYVAADADLDYNDYTVSPTGTWSNSFAPYDMGDGTYRKIVKPGSELTITGTYEIGTFDYTATPTAGNAVAGKIDGGNTEAIEKDYTLQLYDYFMADGTLISDGTTLTDEQKAKCIGIVFCIDSERIGDEEKSALNGNAHGLVIAKRDAATSVEWGRKDTDIAELMNITTMAAAYNDISGLANSKVIWETKDEDGNNKYSLDDYPAFKATYEFRTNEATKAPSCTTGWFMPSIGQWWDIMYNIADYYSLDKESTDSYVYIKQTELVHNLNSLVKDIGGDQIVDSHRIIFWSSSEHNNYDPHGVVIYSDYSNETWFGQTHCNKEYMGIVRSVLAF